MLKYVPWNKDEFPTNSWEVVEMPWECDSSKPSKIVIDVDVNHHGVIVLGGVLVNWSPSILQSYPLTIHLLNVV